MPFVKEILLVFVGGGVGSIIRYLLGKWMLLNHLEWRFGTLLANLLACLLLGLITGFLQWKVKDAEWIKAFWLMGFCGGLSTFSTLIAEWSTPSVLSLSNIILLVLHLSLGVILFFLGHKIIYYFN